MRVCLVCLLALSLAGGAHAQLRPATKEFPKTKDKAKDKKEADLGNAPEKTGADTVGGKTLKEWERDLSNGDPSRRAMAVLAITSFGEQAGASVPLLLKSLADVDVSPRAKVCVALRYLPIEKQYKKDVIRTLAGRLYLTNETQALVRFEAAVTLGRFADDAGLAIPALISGLTDGASWEIRHACASVLWRAGRDPKNGPDERAVKAIIGRLKASKYPATYQEKLELITGLGSMGRPTNPSLLADVIAVFNLYATSKSPTASRSLALWAFAGLVSMLEDAKEIDAAMLALSKFASATHKPEIRVQAATALGLFGTRSKKFVPDLLKMLDDKEQIIVAAAANALARIADPNDKNKFDNDKIVNAFVSTLSLNAQPRKDSSAVEKNNSLNKAAAMVFALVEMKANDKNVHDAMDKLRENKEVDLNLRSLIEQAQKYLREPPKEKEKK